MLQSYHWVKLLYALDKKYVHTGIKEQKKLLMLSLKINLIKIYNYHKT